LQELPLKKHVLKKQMLPVRSKSLDKVVGHTLHKYHHLVVKSWIGLMDLPLTCMPRSFLVACDEELKNFTRFLHALRVPSGTGRS